MKNMKVLNDSYIKSHKIMTLNFALFKNRLYLWSADSNEVSVSDKQNAIFYIPDILKGVIESIFPLASCVIENFSFCIVGIKTSFMRLLHVLYSQLNYSKNVRISTFPVVNGWPSNEARPSVIRWSNLVADDSENVLPSYLNQLSD